MRRLWTRSYNSGNGQSNREFPGGSWQTVALCPSVKRRGDVLLTFQARLTGIRDGAVVRFIRVYPDGTRDGTGDADLCAGQRWVVHQHVLARKNFRVEVQIKSDHPFRVDYCYVKASA